MRFYHGTSVRGWLGILKSGSMDSKKIGDSRVSALYSKFKGNYLTTNRKIAEMYASKAGKGVVIEIEYDPLAPGRINNFKEQQAAGKDYFVEETPLQVDGPDCTIDTKDPLMSKSKMRGDINKTTEEIHMSENTERDLRNAWQKLDESLKKETTAAQHMQATLGKPAIDGEGRQRPAAVQIKHVKKEAAFAGLPADPKAGGKPAVQVSTTDPKKIAPKQAIQINKQADKMKQLNPDWNPAEDSMFEGGVEEGVGVGTDEQWKLMSAYAKVIGQPKMLGRISGDSDALGDVYQDAVNYFTQNPDMLPPEVTLPTPAAPAAPTSEPEDFYNDGIMESIDHSLDLLKKLKK
jgi:hypothetical protein